ncbi:hypothetical protein [Actinacidiphila soli]|nr:hypothetical protein [Actinacidiphila soli]
MRAELSRALGAATGALLSELRQSDAEAAGRLEGPLLELAPAASRD